MARCKWLHPHSLAFILAGAVLIAYLLLLLLVAREGQSQLSEYQDNELTLRVSNYAREMNYFLSNSQARLKALTEDSVVHTYFDNRALGMSMTYGLGASKYQMAQLLRQNQQRFEKEGKPVFERLVMMDFRARVLADTDPAGAILEELPLSAMYHAGERHRIIARRDGGKLVLLQLATVFRHDQPQAILVAKLNRAQITQVLSSQEQPEQASRLQLKTPEGALLAWDAFSSSRAFDDPRNIAHTLPLAVPGFAIQGWFLPLANQDFFTSSWFVAALSLLAFPVVLGFFFMLRMNSRNLVLQTKVGLAARQQRSLADKNQQLLQEVEKRQRSEKLLAYQASHDTLTGLPNRKAGQEALAQWVAKAQAAGQGEQVLLMFIDLDNFKHINDSQGHHYGDQLLVQSARRLGEGADGQGMVARFGGDEFLVIQGQLADRDVARAQAARILRLFEAPFDLEGGRVYASVSIGMALYPEDGVEGNTLIQRADAALYRAKEQGRNGFSFYDASMDHFAQRQVLLDSKLRQALEERQLSVNYQPILALNTGRIVGAEALVRWRDPELGWISPAEFIPLAERNGLIHKLGDQVLAQACSQAARWQALSPLQIAVNVSSIQFRHGEALCQRVLETLDRTGLPAKCLTIEVTESLLLDNHKDLSATLQPWVAHGVGLAIDDFGTGYSALGYLQRFPFSKLKIDKVFLNKLDTSAPDRSLVEAILAMARALGLEVVAEGIEHDWQAQFLRQRGCHFGQGYLYSPAVTAEEFERLLHQESQHQPRKALAVG
ncbi:putative bifunctional diguanylate cyclase/phosphodiesterase [Ferrimonas gelatinilytica]|uniref:Bifunctional diguanylate cyclase/phosphodiesterase n=1 Tax=Ferrimonas gelatinilytica TaxID=1255257 RepID=A0ABP9S0S1_9GAMM